MKKILVFLPLLLTSPTHAQEQQAIRVYCNESQIIWGQLKKEYGEEPIAYGKGPEGTTGIMTLWLNSKTLSWTILVTQENKSCVVGGGTSFTVVDKK